MKDERGTMSERPHSSFITPHSSLIWTIIGILLIAAALRIVGVTQLSPPGITHDEVAHWLINQQILAGEHAIYFTDAYGHEAGYHYWQTLLGALMGDNALALRLASVYLGLIGVSVSFVLARKLFGWQVGIVAMGITAVLFFPVFYSRLGLRAISLPVFSGLSAYFWWRAWLISREPVLSRIEVGAETQRKGVSWFIAGWFICWVESLHLHGSAGSSNFLWAVCTVFGAFSLAGI